jgi:hypothetical protein
MDSRLNALTGSSTLLLLICAVYWGVVEKSIGEKAAEVPKEVQKIYFSIMVVLTIFRIILASHKTALFKREPARINDLTYLTKVQFAFSALVLALIIIPLVYLSGITETAAGYIVRRYPTVTTRSIEISLSVASWIIAGIVGNAAWDFLKHLVNRRR